MDINLNLKNIKNDYTYMLATTSEKLIGQIPTHYVDSIARRLDEIDEIHLTIPKFIENRITCAKEEYFLYKEFKNERLILLNEKEAFIIRTVDDSYEDYIKVVAYSREIKLQKIDIQLEECFLRLYTSNMDENIFSLNELLIEQTGWKLGHVDQNIAYNWSIADTGEGVTEENIRWQGGINTNWYDFLHNIISEQFKCFVFFNSGDKTINMYEVENFGERLELCLAKDQYITSITKSTSSSDIITRLELIGDEEMDIVSATATGYSYLENFSYYINNKEMSEELIAALDLYYKMVEIRTPEWEKLLKEKNAKKDILWDKQRDFTTIEANIIACDNMIKSYKSIKDSVNEALWIAKKAEYIDKETIAKNEIYKLQDEIKLLDEAMMNITLLCKKETATDNEGHLIFTPQLLDELKNYIAVDTYQEDSFLEVKDFIEAGKIKLEKVCKPTNSFTISVINFVSRLIDNNFRKHWNGVIGLGDIITLYDPDTRTEEKIFLTEFEQNFADNSLSLTLSNKKYSTSSTRDIADYLRAAKYTTRSLNAKNYLLMKEKYNKL